MKIQHEHKEDPRQSQESMIEYINLKLSFLGYPAYKNQKQSDFLKIATPLLRSHHEKNRHLPNYPCPADQRIQNFLDDYFNGTQQTLPKLPANTFVLDHPGLARLMSLPPDKDIFTSDIVDSYRVRQGVLHNPKNDRRTTQGVFHIAEGGLPVPDDKIEVPKEVFRNLLIQALNPPRELLRLPFTSTQEHEAELFVSVLLRPTVCPPVEGVFSKKSMEIRFFAPGNLVSNLDFVETIFGNGGDPFLPENDAALDVEHWTGHTGCVILAPHLIHLKKKDLGLPSFDQATQRQRQDGMCWKDPGEIYNAGQAFKITSRDHRGVIVTLIADNYFGYCKKEIKTQISFAANLFGLAEEEHSGGALAHATHDLGEEFQLDPFFARNNNNFTDVTRFLQGKIDVKPQGYAIDKKHPQIIYVPENAKFDLPDQEISWSLPGKKDQRIKLLAHHFYVLPSGYKVFIKKQTGGHAWHLIGIAADGILCHKPCTVSGGGKSEISKSIVDAMIQGPVFTADFHSDMDKVEALLQKDYSGRFKEEYARNRASRPVLSPERSLGSVIKLFTVSHEYTEDYNQWLRTIPDYIKEILLNVKRFYRPEWGGEWRKYFSVDVVNGHLGHELKFNTQKLVANYLRVGLEKDGSWRIFRVRQDFAAADKIQFADDITVSVVVPKEILSGINPEFLQPSQKLILNCENFLFQRPDDAIYRGYDKQAEQDLATPNTFLSNYEPLNLKQVEDIVQDAIHFDAYTEPMKKMLQEFVHERNASAYVVSSAHPRMVDGKPSKNPRYLQKRPDHVSPYKKHLAEIGVRLLRRVPAEKPVHIPVHAVLPGRRNNPPDRRAQVRALCIYNPIHYQELPELFLDFVCSLTGKSPSTTGFGSEGAMTKGPFNALWPVVDLNNALVSFIITGYHAFSSAAGTIGPNYRMDHDISLLMPEIWCRMKPEEQDPKFLIQNGYLEKVRDFQFRGREIKASILGYRITLRFVNAFLGRIFSNPNIVFTEDMLAPEKQNTEVFAEGVENILATQQRVAEHYFTDGSVEAACPPLKALLYIMAHGQYEGKDLNHAEIRNLFTREALIQSDWYQKRLQTKQQRDIELWSMHLRNLENFLSWENHQEIARQLDLEKRRELAQSELAKVKSTEYLKQLMGTIGADPFDKQITSADLPSPKKFISNPN